MNKITYTENEIYNKCNFVFWQHSYDLVQKGNGLYNLIRRTDFNDRYDNITLSECLGKINYKYGFCKKCGLLMIKPFEEFKNVCYCCNKEQ